MLGLFIAAVAYTALLFGAALPYQWLGLLGLAFFLVGPIVASLLDQYRAHRKFDELASVHLEFEAPELRQCLPNHSSIVAIDLSKPFSFQYLFKEEGVAIYRLRQGRSVLDIPSTDPMAASLVRDVLRLAWPPVGPRPST